MNMNPMLLMQLQQRLSLFQQDHPKVMPFLQMLKGNAVKEGTIVEMRVTDPDGNEYVSNIRLTQTDVETIKLSDFLSL